MDLKEARYILAIAHYKSIGKAAKALFISQPSLSKYLKNLEQQLGSPLFPVWNRDTSLLIWENAIYTMPNRSQPLARNGIRNMKILPEEPMDGSILPFPSCSEALYCSLL